jgi:hypothetical protein
LQVQEETPQSARELLREQGLFSSTDHISNDLERLIMDSFLEDDDDRLHMLTLRMADRPGFALGAIFWRDLASQEMAEWITPKGTQSAAAKGVVRIPCDERWGLVRSSLRRIVGMATSGIDFRKENEAFSLKQNDMTGSDIDVGDEVGNEVAPESNHLFDSWVKIELVVTHVDHLGARVGTVLLYLALTHSSILPPSTFAKCDGDDADKEEGEEGEGQHQQHELHAEGQHPTPATHAILHAAGGDQNVPAVRLCK